jgi:hypothetical protein
VAKTATQRAAHTFLLEHFLSGETFTLNEFRKVTGWQKPGTLNTYLRKQYKGLIENIEGGPLISETGRYRVTESFRKFVEWPKFRHHVTQVRIVLTSHERTRSKVLIYEFLMPLTHETELRITLDTLFFKDTIRRKLKAIRPTDLETHFTRLIGQPDEDYLNTIMDFIGEHFVGYSISHVDGRFRAVGIRNYDEVAALLKGGRRYLIDETTAVTRFIFPYGNDEELERLRFLFHELFVRSMIGLAEGESQVWMLESGPEQRVHIWQAPDGQDEEGEDDEEE